MIIRSTCLSLLVLALELSVAGRAAAAPAGERWGTFEVALKGPSDGNPFIDVELSARFTQGDRAVSVQGFYDGAGEYRIRFMPEHEGEWRYQTRSNKADLDGKTGTLTVGKPSAGNHGPVRVRNTYHFGYADGSPYFPIGTTCYAWTHQGDKLEEQTLAALKQSPFNKLRMCVFPKWYAYNRKEPALYYTGIKVAHAVKEEQQAERRSTEHGHRTAGRSPVTR